MWIIGYPLPPSVNQSLMPVVGKHAFSKKTGKPYYKGRLIKTEISKKYLANCLLWKQKNLDAINKFRKELFDLKKSTEFRGEVFALQVDCYFVFHVERLITTNNKSEQLDADNRLKPCWDSLKTILNIDDKCFYAGHCEKLTTIDKEKECTVIKISQIKPRTLDQLKAQMK